MKFKLSAAVLLVCFVAVLAARAVMSQDETFDDQPAFIKQPPSSEQPLVSFPEPNRPAERNEDADSAADALRSQYLELARTKAELMDEETLAGEIAKTKSTISELKAQRRLREAREMLTSIVTEFPKSAAAAQASRMLEAENDAETREEWLPGIDESREADSDTPVLRDDDDRRGTRRRESDTEQFFGGDEEEKTPELDPAIKSGFSRE